MSQLQRLLDSFAATIIEYHQQKTRSNTPPSNVSTITHQEHQAMIVELTDYIMNATKQDETRRPLMLYILHGADQLKYLVDCTTPLDPEATPLLKRQLTDLITNLKKLVSTSHSTLTTVHYNNKEVPLYGCLRGLFTGYSLSISGRVLSEKIFPVLGLTYDTSPETIEGMINGIIDDHLEIIQLQHELHTLKETIHPDITHAQSNLIEPSMLTSTHRSPAQAGMPHRSSTFGISGFFFPPNDITKFFSGLFPKAADANQTSNDTQDDISP